MSTPHLIIAIAWLIALIISAGVWRTRDAPRAGLAALALAAQLPGVIWGASLPREPPPTPTPIAAPAPAPPRSTIDHTTPEDHRDTPPPPAPDSDLPDRLDWYRRRTDTLAR